MTYDTEPQVQVLKLGETAATPTHGPVAGPVGPFIEPVDLAAPHNRTTVPGPGLPNVHFAVAVAVPEIDLGPLLNHDVAPACPANTSVAAKINITANPIEKPLHDYLLVLETPSASG